MIRSFLAVLAGYAVFAVIANFLFPYWFPLDRQTTSAEDLLWITLGVGFAAAVAGGWVTAALVPGRRWKHIQALLLLLLIAAAVNLVWAAGAEPSWFQITQIAVGVAGIVLGGSLKRGNRL